MNAVTTRVEHNLPGGREILDAPCYGCHRVARIVLQRKLTSSEQLAIVLTKPQMNPTQVA